LHGYLCFPSEQETLNTSLDKPTLYFEGPDAIKLARKPMHTLDHMIGEVVETAPFSSQSMIGQTGPN